MLRKLLTFISLFCIIGGLQSQASQTDDTLLIPHFEERPVRAKLYGVNDGLSQGLIYSMTLDHFGRLWLSTKDGLNCYDGQGFRVFRKEQGNANGMAHDHVKSLSVDSLGRLWLVYATGVLGLFDPSAQSFSLPANKSKSDIRFEEILQMQGELMLLRNSDTTQAEAVYSAKVPFEKTDMLRFKKRIEPIYGRPVMKALYDRNKCIVQETESDVIWLATTDSILRYGPITDGSGPVWTKFSMPQEKSDETERYVNFIADIGGTDAFVVDSSLVLHKYDPTSNEFLPFLRLPEGTDLSGGSYLDMSNRLYLFHNDAEFLRINTRDTICERLIPKWNRDFLSLNLQMRTALEDAQGNIWMGTPGSGVVQISCSNDRFVAFNHPYKTYEEGVYKYRTEAPGKTHHYDASLFKDWLALRAEELSDLSLVGLVQKDAQGHFWSGINEATTFNLVQIDAETGQLFRWLSEPIGKHTFGRQFFFGRDGKVWTTLNTPNAPKGLISYNPLTKKSETFAIPHLPVDDDYAAISDWYETPEGDWWLATINGLFYFSPETGDWKQFVKQPGDSTSISGNLLLSICPDPSAPERYLWIGTEGAGLNRFDLRDSTFRTYATDQGLPNNVIYGILPDSHNNLWISTNQGISHFLVKEGTFLNYTARNGLAGNEFNRYEYATAADGSLYFGGTAGLTVIHPEEFYKERSPSTTLITGMKLQNKPIQFIDGSSGILDAPIHASTYLELPYDHRMFSFSFANLDLSSPDENEFKYMLEGFDQKWIDVGTATEATYTNLNPGKYTFKVLGRNSFKKWNHEATTIDITILSPWWGTWWFRAFVLLLVVSTIYGLYKYRLNQLMEVERMRNQIAQDLHDEIGSTLSSISLYSAVMKKTAIDISPKSQSILDRIIHNVSDIMEKMNDMVWTIKSENDSMDQVVNRMRAFAAEMAEAKDIKLDFHSEDSVSKIELAMDKRKEIYLIFKEAVNNAVKYSAASKLSVRLIEGEGSLKMSIRDDGKGFELKNRKEKASGGNGLIGMQRRAERIDAEWRIDSKLREGTTVDLIVPINH